MYLASATNTIIASSSTLHLFDLPASKENNQGTSSLYPQHAYFHTPTPRSTLEHTLHYVGVALPLECDMLYGASTFFALQILHAKLRTLPSACTTSGANSIPNIC